MKEIRVGIIIFVISVASTPLRAGVFLDSDGEEAPLAPAPPTNEVPPFVVVHPLGYEGVGGPIVLKICTRISTFLPSLENAVEIWNGLAPDLENCQGTCAVLGEPATPSAPIDLTSTLLHELGHCAMGLDHTNLGRSNFTNTVDSAAFDSGPDGIEGSGNDLPSPLPGSRMIHWFRTADNNPIKIDSMTIDESTYSRNFNALPNMDSWSANANRLVAAALGAPNANAVMYSGIREGMRYVGLSADEVAMVQYAATGLDSVAGTSDDYTIQLMLSEDCLSADIEVDLFPFDDSEVVGGCNARVQSVDPNPTALTSHYRVTYRTDLFDRLTISLNDDPSLIFDVVFASGFETGDLSDWSSHSP